MKRDPLFVGLDVGGTSMKAGVVDNQGRALSAATMPTEAFKGQKHGLKRMAETIEAALREARLALSDISAIGVATPGTQDLKAGIILDPPNLKPWRNVPVRQYIHDFFKLPTAFQNDANAAAFGEYWAGAGRGVNSLVLFTLGTGIGGGIILGGNILEGEHSAGAELGHVRVEITYPRLCPCGRSGCLEAYTSATSVVKRTMEALAERRESSALSQVFESGGKLGADDVFRAAAAGDTLAQRIVEDTAFYLGIAAVNIMHTLDPDMVLFGGGMIAAGEPFLAQIRSHVKQMAFPVIAEKTQVLYAALGNDAGFIGAAGCAKRLWETLDAATRHR